MISREELTRIARQKEFPLDVIEKDYALTWALKAIYSNEKLFKYLVFKGGTCLSKIYAENYRLSEDLDFSAYKDGKLSTEELKQEIANSFTQANQIGAPNLEIIEKSTHENPGLYLQMRVRYVGPLNHPNQLKLDISLQEWVLYEGQKKVSKEKSYSDIAPFDVHCYDLQEILLEKLRAAMQRGKTRDYYDLWQLMTRNDLMLLRGEGDEENDNELGRIRNNLVDKCQNKDVPYEPEVMFSETQLSEAEKEWQNSLGRLVKNLPEFSTVISTLKKIFWREAELTEFSKTLDVNMLRNLRRGKVGTQHLLRRSVELIIVKLSSKKVGEVIQALRVIEKMYAYMPEMSVYNKTLFPSIDKLSNDADKEIKQKALAIRQAIIKGEY